MEPGEISNGWIYGYNELGWWCRWRVIGTTKVQPLKGEYWQNGVGWSPLPDFAEE